MSKLLPRDPWDKLAAHTQARIALGRAGTGLPTREVLSFGLAHAQARDAVHLPLAVETIRNQLAELGQTCLHVTSRADDRRIYLQRPDLGRRLSENSAIALGQHVGDYDLAIILADGLSALAVERQAVVTLNALLPLLADFTVAPIVLAEQARVALADEAGELLGARQVLMLLGERPGLSSPDSLGAYLTFAPRLGRLDADRNCVSNIRPQGLPPAQAAAKLVWLLRAARQRGLSGIGLKDESDLALIGNKRQL
ncbi:ethanolamine ammonia-lyase subunit EutC [Chitinimonas sp. BJB300]|uniref:ethanolamine ammonia-lyase subunit EutC n=1 Tax=Chitinimonas sp. BJB300 TaxID=1559339 RepID=UPI000C0CB4EA|nr:ethanolamine ammonia-lyase subunit EutC [Chitinimonas sp. BJB300]PHV13409.1 ethanolamine ammonia-lyase [Chitinimonas sp. BJB300]TSJ89729.1 ethanolamine ammonia-lyase subunit EutC [Chitinimonas sp. BJB300]